MGKSFPSATRIQELTRIVSSSEKLQKTKHRLNPNPSSSQIRIPANNNKNNSDRTRVDPERVVSRAEMSREGQNRQPLSLVVADCVKRWFSETLKEAKAGDSSMQVLVGQMYYSGYGVSKDPLKGRAWIGRASRSRSSALRVCNKQPGYNASDSDSEEVKETTSNV